MRNFRALTYDELTNISRPGYNPGGNMEMYPYTLFDTAQVANGATSSTFFSVGRTGILTNLESPGSLPSPNFFQIGEIHVTPQIVITGAADPQQWNDMDEIVRAARGQLSLKIQSKLYGPWPITQAQGLGGVTGFGIAMADATAESLLQANNGVPGGSGIPIDGNLVLTPRASFQATLEWDRALVLSATVFVQVAMSGAYYQAIR